jgi:hypothetical protein
MILFLIYFTIYAKIRFSVELNSVSLRNNLKVQKIMAMPIKSPPVLRGKEALEFYKKVAEFKDDTSKEEAQASFRKWKVYFAEQERLHPSTPW